jgi:hypothetical protein
LIAEKGRKCKFAPAPGASAIFVAVRSVEFRNAEDARAWNVHVHHFTKPLFGEVVADVTAQERDRF